jgi:hypothetical protein
LAKSGLAKLTTITIYYLKRPLRCIVADN